MSTKTRNDLGMLRLQSGLRLSAVAPFYRGGSTVMRCSQIEREPFLARDVKQDYRKAIKQAARARLKAARIDFRNLKMESAGKR